MDKCCELHPPTKCGCEKCPECGAPGKSVRRLTLGALLKADQRSKIPIQDEFCFCGTQTCDVVYFRPNGVLFRKNDLAAPVGLKEPNNPAAPVCYCFDWTPEKIQSEIKNTGKSTVIDKIKTQVKAENCYCEITNPQGSCCLGNVSHVVKKTMDSSIK